MSEADTIGALPEPAGKRKILVLALLTVFGAIAGFSTVYMGIWSPSALLGQRDSMADAEPQIVFVDIPQVIISLPGPRQRTLVMSVKIESDAAQVDHIQKMTPRISDAFNGFLSEIDPMALQRRGILEIVRNEMLHRISLVLGPDSFGDLLITEFRIQ